ncbi:MAG: MFS transporter [Patescibacteria group bacterium]
MQPKHLRRITYAFAFFVTLHVALITYINSNALARIVGQNHVDIVYTGGFLIALVFLLVLPRLLRNNGDVRTTLALIVLQIGTLCGLAFFPASPLFVFFFLIQLIIPPLLYLDIDVFLEHATKDETTGRTRGAFLTFLNVAFLISPLITGFVLGQGEVYSLVYLLSAGVLLPALALILVAFKHFKDPPYRHIEIVDGIRKVVASKNLRGIFISNFLLRCFFAVMTIFMPLYLHSELQLPWITIGGLFTVMLLPFVLFEYPLGRLADTRFGEKEILACGFFVMASATALIPFIPASALVLLSITLFMTRVGASALESMNDTFFFKHVSETDTETIALFRMFEPLSYIIAPLLAGLVLVFIDIRFIFLVLGAVMTLGIPVALGLRDTR